MKKVLSTNKLLVLSILTGLVSGLGALLFFYMLHFFSSYFIGYLAGFKVPSPGGETSPFHINGETTYKPWLLVILPAIGGLLSGVIVYSFAPEAEGHGTDAVIESFHKFSGYIRSRVPVIKLIASALTIGTGGSAGREGPIAQIGAGFASFISNFLKLTAREREILVVCGAASGIGSIFRAPFGGSIFGIEVLYKRDYEVDAFIYSVISCFAGYGVFASVVGWKPIFITPFYTFSPKELPLFALLGIISGVIAIIYVSVFYGLRDKFFRKMKIPNHFKPAIGGIMLGLLGFFFPQAIGTGYGWMQLAINGELGLSLMLGLIFAKIFATSFTISSGGSGGVYAPSLTIGAMVGGSIGMLLKQAFPAIITNPGVFTLIGMASFFSAAAKCPISPIIMVSEMTGDYNVLVPAILASTISYFSSGEYTIYEKQVISKTHSPAHTDRIISELGRRAYKVTDKIKKALIAFKVKDVMTKKVFSVNPDSTVADLYDLILKTDHHGFPVIKNNKLIGLVTLHELRSFPKEKWKELKVENVMVKHVKTISAEELIYDAIVKMARAGVGRLIVVSKDDPNKVVGIITKTDLMKAYNTALLVSI